VMDFTIAMIQARHEERVAAAGVIAALFCDDLDEAVRRLENVRDSAREMERALPRKEKRQIRITRNVASWADDMLAPVRQLAEREKRSAA
jgi:hypothetical protein